MTEVLWHGRGGNGAFTAARALGAAYALNNPARYALAFPAFGPERRGAPVKAFTKLDTRPIAARDEIKRSDFTIFLDDTLYTPEALDALKDGGYVIVNTKRRDFDARVVAIDAEGIARRTLGRPIANTPMLGALCALWDGISMEEIEAGIDAVLPERLRAGNKAAALAAYEFIAREVRP
jgi:pyruvate ferredoxin oxidoreductase gamma subunit